MIDHRVLVVHETSSKLEHAILTILLFSSVENIDNTKDDRSSQGPPTPPPPTPRKAVQDRVGLYSVTGGTTIHWPVQVAAN
jgi:hypothetical protein